MFFHHLTDQVSHPYKTTGEVTDHYNLIFIFLEILNFSTQITMPATPPILKDFLARPLKNVL